MNSKSCSASNLKWLTKVMVCLVVYLFADSSMILGEQFNDSSKYVQSFWEAINASNDKQAMLTGDSVFNSLDEKYGGSKNFVALKSRLRMTQMLAARLTNELQSATKKTLQSTALELFEGGKKSNNITVTPAMHYYKSAKQMFAKPIGINDFSTEEKKFLATYYDLKLRSGISSIAKSGKALAVAEPKFKGTYNYILILPLLHLSDKRPINIEVLPKWIQKPNQLDAISGSCLLHYGLPLHAMMLAKQSADLQGNHFSSVEFYKDAAVKCKAASHVNVAVECLQRALLSGLPNHEADVVVDLKFEIVQLWIDSKNYSLAAGSAKEIFKDHPDHSNAGRAIWMYYYSLRKLLKL